MKEIIEFDLDEGRMDYLDDMIDVFSKDGCEMVDILFDRFLKKYYADIDVSNERMTICNDRDLISTDSKYLHISL